MRQFFAIDDHADHQFSGFEAFPDQGVADQTLMGFLLIRRYMVFDHIFLDALKDLLIFLNT